MTDLSVGTGYVGSACGMRGHLAKHVQAFKGLLLAMKRRLTNVNKTGTLRHLEGG